MLENGNLILYVFHVLWSGSPVCLLTGDYLQLFETVQPSLQNQGDSLTTIHGCHLIFPGLVSLSLKYNNLSCKLLGLGDAYKASIMVPY